jgi:hypothetical protein
MNRKTVFLGIAIVLCVLFSYVAASSYHDYRIAHAQMREYVTEGEYNDFVEKQHIARYKFAAPYCRGKTVADIASGSGYGTKILRSTAASVDGYDIKDFGFNKVIDLEKESWQKSYDVLVSFETIEHLRNPEFFLENARVKCKQFIFSSPTGETPGFNHFHKQTWSAGQLKALIEHSFTCQYFMQKSGSDRIEKQSPEIGFLIGVCTPRQKSEQD